VAVGITIPTLSVVFYNRQQTEGRGRVTSGSDRSIGCKHMCAAVREAPEYDFHFISFLE
jgi:hypothetical protein